MRRISLPPTSNLAIDTEIRTSVSAASSPSNSTHASLKSIATDTLALASQIESAEEEVEEYV